MRGRRLITVSYSITGKGITLGEVDTGVLSTHPELAGKTISEVYTDGYVVDWNSQYHGTHVAGIMAADRNGKGMEGVAFDANLAAVGVLFTDPEATATAMASLEQRNDVKIINNSWNAPLCTYYELQAGTTITDLQKQLMGDAMDAELYKLATEYDKVIVMSAGNYGSLGGVLPAAAPTYYPQLNNWVSVLDLDSSDKSLHLSSCLAKGSEDYSIAAPGTDILSLYAAGTGKSYIYMTGTSMAAPYVAGALGLVEQAYPWMSGRNLTDTILSTANKSFTAPAYHIDMDEKFSLETYKSTLQLHVMFLNHPGTITETEVQQALDNYYHTGNNAWSLGAYYVINTFEEFKELYAGTLSIDTLKERWAAKYNDYSGIVAGDALSVSFDELYGQGILDVGKAVGGIAQHNANRMSTSDIDAAHGLLYPLDFDNYTSTFSNDISEQLWTPSHHYSDSSVPNLQADYATMASQTCVCLLKSGTGTLLLTGTNTYNGDTVVRGGVLGIDNRSDGTGGTLVNSNVYVESGGSLMGNGTIDKNLYSTGVLLAEIPDTGTYAGYLTVAGTANVDGSQVGIYHGLPGETEEVLTAATLTGSIANTSPATAYAQTGLLSAYGYQVGNSLYATTVQANNMGDLDSNQSQSFLAADNLNAALGTSGRTALRALYSLNSRDAAVAMTDLAGPDAARVAATIQQSDIIGRAMRDRSSLPQDKLAKDDGIWAHLDRGWGNLGNGDAHINRTEITVGIDRAASKHWHTGFLGSFGDDTYNNNTAYATMKDWRLGFYGDYHVNRHDAYVYADYGWQSTKFNRSIRFAGLTSSDETINGRIAELGGEYTYDMTSKDKYGWHLGPYAGFQVSRYNQDGYTETGLDIYNHNVDSMRNTYTAGTLGLQARRELPSGSNVVMRVGYKHTFAGNDPRIPYSYSSAPGHSYDARSDLDNHRMVCSVSGGAILKHGWSISGGLSIEKGSHDKDRTISLTAKKVLY